MLSTAENLTYRSLKPDSVQKVLFVIAMPEEAQSVIEKLGLVKDDATVSTSYDMFSSLIDCYIPQHYHTTKTKEQDAKYNGDPDVPQQSEYNKQMAISPFVVVPKLDPVHQVPSIGAESAVTAVLGACLKYNLTPTDLIVSAGTCGGIQQYKKELKGQDTDAPLENDSNTDNINIKSQQQTLVKQGDIFIPDSIKFLTRSVPFPIFRGFIKGDYSAMYSKVLINPTQVKEVIQSENMTSNMPLNLKIGTIGTNDSFCDDGEIPRKLGCHVVEMEACIEFRVVVGLNNGSALIDNENIGPGFTCLKIVSDVNELPDSSKATESDQPSQSDQAGAFLEFIDKKKVNQKNGEADKISEEGTSDIGGGVSKLGLVCKCLIDGLIASKNR